jgi:ABC-type nitrate/sulfonate/bicarbonate transport system substrate-binding protein
VIAPRIRSEQKRAREHGIVAAELVLVVLLSLVAAFNTQAKDINLGWSGQGSWSTLPYIVAAERGFFEKEGLKVRLITFRGTNLMLTALLAGELDYATILPFLTRSLGSWIAGKNPRRRDQE